MNVKEIASHNELIQQIGKKEKAFLLLFKRGSEKSECSLKNLAEIEESQPEIAFYKADVSSVRDIHPRYNITSVPTILEFEKGRFTNVIKGCHEPGFYKSFFENAMYSVKADGSVKPRKRVTVYSTPTCSWCRTLKTHLNKHGIRYRDVDVSRDTNAAQEMQRKSGQMGVPQTDIDDQIIVGFDKTRINNLLGITQS